MDSNRVFGLDPDPIGATFVELAIQSQALVFKRWGLIRPSGSQVSHRLQLTLEEFTPLLQGAIVGLEVVDRMYRPGKQQAALQKTREMGEKLLDSASAVTPWVYSFPGIARLGPEETFTQGSWLHRLTGLRHPAPHDLLRELQYSVQGTGKRLRNPHFRDALGVAVLAFRLTLRNDWKARLAIPPRNRNL